MPDLKISQLTAGNPAQSGDEIPINRSGSNFKITAGSIASLASISTPLTVPGTASSTGELRLAEDTDNGTNYVGFAAPASIASNLTWTLPATDGTSNQVLQTNGSGVLSWGAPSGGGTKTISVFTPLDNQPPASNFATLDTRNSVAVLDFDAATDESAVFVGVIPEGAVLTSGLIVRISWAATSATSGDCVWEVSFEKTTGHDIDADGFDTVQTGTTTTSGTSGVVNTTAITITTIDSLAANDVFRLKVTRDANAVGDTMTGDAELIGVELETV